MARGRLETTVTRRKKGDPAAERVAAAIMEEFSPKTAEEAQEALRSVFGPMIETMLKAELEAHLGYPDNDKGPKDGPNRRNGYTRKVVRTSAGEVPIDVPRDRDATFEPAVVPKGERDLTGIESRVMSMYARGMSQRDIAATVREIYGFSMSAETVSAITDRVWEELERWRSRPLEPVYAFMFVDCLYVPVRRGRGARSMAVYAIVAYDLAGRKDVLGLWMQETEGAHHWMGVFDELRQRGVEDVLFVSMDGVSGLADGLRAIFDNVNLKSADCATVSAPVAPTHMRHANQRTLAVFGYSSFLFSAGRSLRRYDLPVIFSIVQWWQTLSAMALAATSSPNTPAQPPIPTLVVMIVERCSYRVDTSWNMRSAPCSSMSR